MISAELLPQMRRTAGGRSPFPGRPRLFLDRSGIRGTNRFPERSPVIAEGMPQ